MYTQRYSFTPWIEGKVGKVSKLLHLSSSNYIVYSRYLLHVGPPDELGPEVEVLSVRLFHVQDQGLVGVLQVTLNTGGENR